MEKEIKDLELIERYLEKTLPNEERLQFETRLKEDEEFSTLYKEIKLVIAGVKHSSRKDLKKQIAGFAAELPAFSEYRLQSDIDLERDFGLQVIESNLKVSARNEAQSSKSSNQSWSYGIAAAIALVIAATFLFFNQTPPEKAYNLAYQEIGEGPYKFLADDEDPINLSRGTRKEDLPQKILNAEQQAYLSYQSLDYQDAIKNFEMAKGEIGAQSPKFLFYLGNAYLADDQPQKAIKTFNELLTLPNNLISDYSSRAKWYLGLAYLKNEEMDKAKETFEELSSNASDSYKEKADQVIEEISWGIF